MKNLIKTIVTFIVVLVLLYILNSVYGICKKNYFNDFTRAELNLNLSEFSRDKDVQYTKGVYSYRITSNVMNDATLCKTLEVEKNTPYKVSCMVKTENVEGNKYKFKR